MNEGVNKLSRRKNIFVTKRFWGNLFSWRRKFKRYPTETFFNCFYFHDKPIQKTNQKRNMKTVEITNGVIYSSCKIAKKILS